MYVLILNKKKYQSRLKNASLAVDDICSQIKENHHHDTDKVSNTMCGILIELFVYGDTKEVSIDYK